MSRSGMPFSYSKYQVARISMSCGIGSNSLNKQMNFKSVTSCTYQFSSRKQYATVTKDISNPPIKITTNCITSFDYMSSFITKNSSQNEKFS